MALLSWTASYNVFHLMCILVTVGLQLYCVNRYLLNEDISVVHYKRFHSDKDAIYPSFSFCILPPFLENELKKYGNGINISSYVKFLNGQIWDERMLKIDYDNVTVSLSDNLLYAYIRLHNTSGYIYTPKSYVSFRSAVRKCFTFDVRFFEKTLVFYLGMYIRNSIFQKGIRSRYSDGGGLYTYIHYPGQRLASYYTLKYEWQSRLNKSANYKMSFNIKNIDAVSLRNKPQKPCITRWKNYDQIIMDEIIREAGCRPPHWTTSLNLTLCSNATQMKKIPTSQPTTTRVQDFDPPCKVIERLDYIYYEEDEKNDVLRRLANESYFHLLQQYRQVGFRNTIQTKAYNLDSLVGNIGGYMGLFLGYALIQFPKLVVALFVSAKRTILNRKASNEYKSYTDVEVGNDVKCEKKSQDNKRNLEPKKMPRLIPVYVNRNLTVKMSAKSNDVPYGRRKDDKIMPWLMTKINDINV